VCFAPEENFLEENVVLKDLRFSRGEEISGTSSWG